MERRSDSGNRESAEGSKTPAIERACKRRRKIERHLVVRLQLSVTNNLFKQILKRLRLSQKPSAS